MSSSPLLRFLAVPLAALFVFLPLAHAEERAQARAQALLTFEGVPARWQTAYAPGAVVRQQREAMTPEDRTAADASPEMRLGLKALDSAASPAFGADTSLAAIAAAVTAAGQDAAPVSSAALEAAQHLARLRADYAAMDDAGRAAFFTSHRAQPPDAARADLLARMAVGDLSEVDFSNQLLLGAVVRALVRDGPDQFAGLPDKTLDTAIDTLWSRGVTSQHSHNLMLVMREFERQITQALLAALPDADVAALLAWRSDAQADAEREALVGTYRSEVKAGGARAIRSLLRAWPR
jgi:hypothetical protein